VGHDLADPPAGKGGGGVESVGLEFAKQRERGPAFCLHGPNDVWLVHLGGSSCGGGCTSVGFASVGGTDGCGGG
jgi:hypothetical protein